MPSAEPDCSKFEMFPRHSAPDELEMTTTFGTRAYFPAWELPGSSLVELRIKANSETT